MENDAVCIVLPKDGMGPTQFSEQCSYGDPRVLAFPEHANIICVG